MISQAGDNLASFERANWRVYQRNTVRVVREAFEHMRPQEVRPILDFAEEELRYPTGRYKGMKFSRHYQPATSLLLEQMANPHWLHTFVVGPHQAGKSLSISIFALYVLFELQRDLIYGMPDVAMRGVKWQKDLRPLVVNSRYFRLMPSRGAGSKGGVSEIILFQNGVSLQFMGSGGGDSQRAGATARYLIITEAEKFGVRAANSDEASKFQQILGRVAHYAGQEKVVAESTITTEEGLMWSEFTSGSQSVVRIQCHSCRDYVAPERKDLVGYEDAKTEGAARENGRFSCPKCGILWTEEQRRDMLRTARLVHAGQTVDSSGSVTGDIPPTRKLGFRFSAATNAFSDAGSIAVEEFNLLKATTPSKKDSLERALRQFRFAVPVQPSQVEIDPLNGVRLMKRVADTQRGTAQAGTTRLMAGCDVRRTQLHWFVIGFGDDVAPRVVDWGFERMNRENTLFEVEIRRVGEHLQERFNQGFPVDDGVLLPVTFTLVDAGWETNQIQELCDKDDWWLPVMGFGSGVLKSQNYRRSRSARVAADGFHVAMVADRMLVELDANYGKSSLHQRLRLELSNPYALSFPQSEESDLRALIQQLTSESEIEEFVGGEVVSKFGEPKGPNHWLDAASYALVADRVYALIQELVESEIEDGQSEPVEWEEDLIVGGDWG